MKRYQLDVYFEERDKVLAEVITTEDTTALYEFCEKYRISKPPGTIGTMAGVCKAVLNIEKSKYIDETVKIKASIILASLGMSHEIG